MVEQGVTLANDLPSYARDLNEAFNENPQLEELNKDYGITKKLEEAAENLVSRLGEAAGALADIGAGVVELGLRGGDHPGDEHVHGQPRGALA